MAEGYATAATIHEVTGASVIIGYNANNLIPVAQSIRQTYPNNPLVIVGDNDESGTGQKCAKEAADRSGATVIIPPELGDANDYHMAGHDLKELLEGTDKPDWLIPVSEFVKKPAPIKWLIKGWVQANACMMMFGPSGSGKTFVAIDMALRIASDIDDWQDNRVRHGGVIYLAGEGHYGLKARIAGWLSYFGVAPKTLSLWVSRDGCDLNTAEGYRRTVENISKTGMPVSLIVIDTLHRFLQGDENSAQDAKTMLDACSRLMREFDCSVLLVHHTGVAQEAQKRARGSSAWKGAQDIEISVCNKGSGAITVEQTKSKDTELAQPIQLQQEEIDVPGWIDEDGDQVTTVVLRAREEETDIEPKKKLPESLNFAMNTYREAAYKKGRLTSKGFSGVHLEEWREVYYERSPQDNSTAKRQAFSRGRDGLVKKGILIASNDFYRPTDEIEVSTIVLYLKENRGQI
nr:AAA family ATPase [Dethiosulfovibrio faecalis]